MEKNWRNKITGRAHNIAELNTWQKEMLGKIQLGLSGIEKAFPLMPMNCTATTKRLIQMETFKEL